MLHWLGEVFQLQGTGYAALPQFLTSLGIGLLLGIERERKQDPRAGVRTFALTCLFGTLSGHVPERVGAHQRLHPPGTGAD